MGARPKRDHEPRPRGLEAWRRRVPEAEHLDPRCVRVRWKNEYSVLLRVSLWLLVSQNMPPVRILFLLLDQERRQFFVSLSFSRHPLMSVARFIQPMAMKNL